LLKVYKIYLCKYDRIVTPSNYLLSSLLSLLGLLKGGNLLRGMSDSWAKGRAPENWDFL